MVNLIAFKLMPMLKKQMIGNSYRRFKPENLWVSLNWTHPNTMRLQIMFTFGGYDFLIPLPKRVLRRILAFEKELLLAKGAKLTAVVSTNLHVSDRNRFYVNVGNLKNYLLNYRNPVTSTEKLINAEYLLNNCQVKNFK